jgi:hypothetical protein
VTYFTRSNVHVDRCSSAWLIKRFIDMQAEFRFIEDGDTPPANAIGFDITGAQWGHRGNTCTFETILDIHHLDDPVLVQIGQIVHGADIVDDFDSTLESPGFDLIIRGIRLISDSDDDALRQSSALMDALYEAIRLGYRR